MKIIYLSALLVMSLNNLFPNYVHVCLLLVLGSADIIHSGTDPPLPLLGNTGSVRI